MHSQRLLPIVTVILLAGCAHHSPRAADGGAPSPVEGATAEGSGDGVNGGESTATVATTGRSANGAAQANAEPGTEPSAAGRRENPFFHESTLPFQAPDFDAIRVADFQPAMEEGMKRHLAEVESIANESSPPTFENTIIPLERSGQLLNRVSAVFFGLAQANTNDTIQEIQTEMAPRLAAHSDSIHLNSKLFQRIQKIYDSRDASGLDSGQKHLVERYHRDFVRAGALLSDADKSRLRELNQEESKLSTEFQNKLLAATKDGAVVVKDSAMLAGLSDGDVAAAAAAAKRRGIDDAWVIVLQNTTQQPAQASLENRDLRKRLFEASINRAEQGDSSDTREVIRRLAKIRAEQAKLLGFPTYAAYSLDDKMAKTPEAAINLMTSIAPAATAKARSEAAKMQALINREGGNFELQPWDWQYYAEKVRKAEYDLDESQIKPYFELDRVLEDGVFYAANKMYGITFKERKDIPVYQPDVRVYEVFEADGTPLALFYCDYFKRDNKSGGAWMSEFVGQSKLLGTKPVVYNVANFTKPAPGKPALLTFDDVTTMFHEFGHALHGMFSDVRYPTQSGTDVPRDFVEFPSQFNEHWALDPEVFAHYARHYQTGAPMPEDLVAKIRKSRTFNQGFALTEYLEASLLDMAWHDLPASAPEQQVDSFEVAALERYGVHLHEVPPRYRTSYFAHIWGSGYAAGYYSYLWSEVLDDDAYYWFKEHGGMTRANGQRFRDMILSQGGTEDAGAMYRAFRGRDPSVEALLEERGLK
ncbi:MAG TPA: peptidyl-dipeptidase Dcp [Gemmatimonadaceae bacterium]|nr:peptidyl-dipeptidase Dcp [Gemmatimonadaceae bacterium]